MFFMFFGGVASTIFNMHWSAVRGDHRRHRHRRLQDSSCMTQSEELRILWTLIVRQSMEAQGCVRFVFFVARRRKDDNLISGWVSRLHLYTLVISSCNAFVTSGARQSPKSSCPWLILLEFQHAGIFPLHGDWALCALSWMWFVLICRINLYPDFVQSRFRSWPFSSSWGRCGDRGHFHILVLLRWRYWWNLDIDGQWTGQDEDLKAGLLHTIAILSNFHVERCWKMMWDYRVLLGIERRPLDSANSNCSPDMIRYDQMGELVMNW